MQEPLKRIVLLMTYVLHSYCLERLQLCEEISSFFPNFCTYDIAKKQCSHLCEDNKKIPQLSCGKKKTLLSSRRRRIIGGDASDKEEWRWHVSLRFYGEHYCGGSVLSKHFVLTAAHCVDKKYSSDLPDHFTVVAGARHRFLHEEFQQVVKVKRIIVHKHYLPKCIPRLDLCFYVVNNDIAILELEEAIQMEDVNKGSICLPDDSYSIPDQYPCFIVGWGYTQFEGNYSDTLLSAPIKTVPNSVCNEERAFNNSVNSNITICAGDSNATVSPCNADSGGGLACENNGTWYLHGIISSGYKCGGPNAYSLYANVSAFEGWIIENLFLQSYSNSGRECSYDLIILVAFYAMNVVIAIYW